MAYKKTYGRKQQRRRYGRKPQSKFARTLYQGASTASKAFALAKSAVSTAAMLKGIINSEKKKFDVLSSGALTIDQAGQVLLNTGQVSQGDTVSQRNGNSILAKHLSFRGQLGAQGITGCVVRLFVVQDNQQVSDTAPTFTDVFTINNGAPLLNSATVGRFTILHSKTYNLSVNTCNVVAYDFDIPLNHHMRYNGAAGADVQKGNIYILGMSDISTGGAVKPFFTGWSRLTYYDN